MSSVLDLVVEVSLLDERMTAVSTAIRTAAAGWDGVERPIRTYPPVTG